MKKFAVILTVIGASVFSTQVHAQMKQGDFHFGVGLNLGLPLSDFHQGYSFGVGGQVQAEYAFAEKVTGVATSGYTSFFGKTQTIQDPFSGTSISVKNPAVGYIPIIVGPRFYATENFFVGAQIGLGILTGGGTSTSAFDYYPQIGYNADPVQLVLGYNGLSKNGATNSHLGLTVFYTFGGGK